MIEITVFILLVLIWIVLSSINYKLGRLVGALGKLPDLVLALKNLEQVELPVLSAAVSEVSRSLDEIQYPLTINRN